MEPADGFWSSVGPYLLGGMAVLTGVIYTSIRDDLKWCKEKLIKLYNHLNIDLDK